MLDKLTEEQKNRLANLCEQIHNIFVKEDNGFTEDSIDEYYNSPLYKAIDDIAYKLNRCG